VGINDATTPETVLFQDILHYKVVVVGIYPDIVAMFETPFEAGAGSDTVFLPIASSQASFQTLFNGLIRLTGTTFSADLYGVEKITFTDQSILLV
jgi:hypothetical protein